MSGEMTVRTTSKAKALMKALNVSVSVLPLLPAQEDNSRRVIGIEAFVIPKGWAWVKTASDKFFRKFLGPRQIENPRILALDS